MSASRPSTASFCSVLNARSGLVHRVRRDYYGGATVELRLMARGFIFLPTYCLAASLRFPLSLRPSRFWTCDSKSVLRGIDSVYEFDGKIDEREDTETTSLTLYPLEAPIHALFSTSSTRSSTLRCYRYQPWT